ncbi:collagen-like triple helix repeat-containing protein [Sunxiuqinia sp. A32]|uniref:collagen-like triple helix repeat-containing protein n=1 Tax=Sunxiuqinia sp. A32 TaxID=3461496 RepID=UPI0040464E62
MREVIRLLFIAAMVLFIIPSCVKEGPPGLDGADGADGTNGINGAAGADGTATCAECHSDDQKLFAIENQWAVSGHGIGAAFERNTGECAVCHTSQGFIGNLDGSYVWEANGVPVAGAKIDNPNPQNCYTCHNIHETYTSADLALRVSGAITLRNTSNTHDFGKGDVCASCHQGRTVEDFPVAGGPDVTFSGTRYGVHHGPQGNVIAGVGMGLFEVGDGLVNSAHSTQIADACVTCHMADAYGTQAGGHTWWMDYDYHGHMAINDAGCKSTECHPAGEDITVLVEASQLEIELLLTQLKALLDAEGITNPGSDNSVGGTYPALVAGACLDYKALVEDKSLGVHNPKYVKKLLQNLIAALE